MERGSGWPAEYVECEGCGGVIRCREFVCPGCGRSRPHTYVPPVNGNEDAEPDTE
jgi:hypothetical protein